MAEMVDWMDGDRGGLVTTPRASTYPACAGKMVQRLWGSVQHNMALALPHK